MGKKIVAIILSLMYVFTVSIMSVSIENISFGAVPGGAGMPNTYLDQLMKQKAAEEQAPNEQTSKIAPGEDQLVPLQGQLTVPGQDQTQPANLEKFKVLVKFDKITVHNAHEGTFSGDGEYDLKAYVHGILVDLTKLSTWRDAGLTDVSDGETVTFPPTSIITANFDNSLPLPLMIMTFGEEADSCPTATYPSNIQPIYLDALANETAKALGAANGTAGQKGGATTLEAGGAAAGAAVGGAYGGPVGAAVGAKVGEVVGSKLGSVVNYAECKANSNEKLGTIEQTYMPPTFGAGTHNVKSSSGDFTLTYSIIANKVQ